MIQPDGILNVWQYDVMHKLFLHKDLLLYCNIYLCEEYCNTASNHQWQPLVPEPSLTQVYEEKTNGVRHF